MTERYILGLKLIGFVFVGFVYLFFIHPNMQIESNKNI